MFVEYREYCETIQTDTRLTVQSEATIGTTRVPIVGAVGAVGVAHMDCAQELPGAEPGLSAEMQMDQHLQGIAQIAEQKQGVLDCRAFEVQRFGVPIPRTDHRSSTVAGMTHSQHAACGNKKVWLGSCRGVC